MAPISLVPRETVSSVGTVSERLLYLFLAFQIVDQTMLPILVATFIFSSVKRRPALINVCFTWIFTGIISSLLLYAGKHVGPEPPKLLCTTQAALLDAVLPMDSVAILVLMYQTFSMLRTPKKQFSKWLAYTLLILPYVVFLCFSMAASLLALQHPENVTRSRRFFYCSFQNTIFSDSFSLFTAVVLFVATGYQIAIAVLLHKNWSALRSEVQTLGRILVFGSYIFLTLILSLLSLSPQRSPIPDLFTASVGTMLTLSLASQSDLHQVWFPWWYCRHPRPKLEPLPDDQSTISFRSPSIRV